MKIVTSFNPFGRIDRQQYCLSTWKKYGLKIVAFQTQEEIELLRDGFQGVEFIASSESPPKIFDLCNLSVDQDPALVVNSDISIKSNSFDFQNDWRVHKKTLTVGIRHERDPTGTKTLTRYGVDAFLITRPMADTLPNLDFRIGKPVWDFWLIWHFAALDYIIKPIKRGLIHHRHKQVWTKQTHDQNMKTFTDHYGVNHNLLSHAVLGLTGRT